MSLSRPKITAVGNNAWTFKGAGKLFKDKDKAEKARSKMYPKAKVTAKTTVKAPDIISKVESRTITRDNSRKI